MIALLSYFLVTVGKIHVEKFCLRDVFSHRTFCENLTPEGKYSLRNSENLQETIQMKLSNIQKTFSQHFSQSTLNFKHFEKKYYPRCEYIFEMTHCERHR